MKYGCLCYITIKVCLLIVYVVDISACEYIVQSKKQDFEMYIQTEHGVFY